jgi:hypothetical protein
MAKESSKVEVEEASGPTMQAPYGVQDMNAPMEPDTPDMGIDEDVERVLTDEVHVDMGRGPLTFKPGDTIVIRDGSIIRATTREGMEYEFVPAHVAAAERRASDVRAQDLHQNLSAAPHSTPDAPASPAPDPTTELQIGHEQTGAFEETADAITGQEGSLFEEGFRAIEDAEPVPAEDMPAANPPEPEEPPTEEPPTEEEQPVEEPEETTARQRDSTGKFAPSTPPEAA